ncbi:MAG: DinB family protein [Bacteroidota bacterium]|nr:DinB family protein [Bacteroidota bacterium]
MIKIEKPKSGEYDPYAIMYIKLLPDDGRVLHHLKNNFTKTKRFISSLPKKKLTYRYSKDKWTIKEILVHIIDDERIYAYRALRIARGDKTPLPGFEQNDYVPFSKANERTLANIFTEYETVRNATLSLFNSFNKEDLVRTGTANDHMVSVRALIYHLAGHELHHMNIIKERYL